MTPAELAERTASASASDATLALISSIAHELRTPLAALSASAEMLDTADDEDDRRHFSAIIQRQTRRLNDIIESMLQAYGATSARPVDPGAARGLARLLEEARAEQQSAYPGHRFIAEIEPGRTTSADERMLAIVVTNLLSNAAKYSPVNSTVRLVCRREGEDVCIRVEDQGSGVPEYMRQDIFRAGERAGRCEQPGLGLGLFVVHRLCAVLGARIMVEDTTEGEGACFVVTLPK